ncbi:hypothetical protein VMCG_02144 [Cytospora schulzeri]|uniref:Uncharacterized protein n=1 Tax=Cytospora schulzeri TaxID=448051 RepID=A0A423X2S6_9PEZI|nr:hypothetical protein VMCG_02144 [Valsa malicola]
MTKMQNKVQSFLGDPDFPKVAIDSSREGKIFLYQDLFSKYSRLEFTHGQDRPVAMAGIERRLVESFGVRGGFGILDDDDEMPGLLRRSLLWCRARTTPRLKKVNFEGANSLKQIVSPPPTWSWMAYEGAINYLKVVNGAVDWNTEGVHSPWSSSPKCTWSYSGDESNGALEMKVVAWECDSQAMKLEKDENIINLDDPERADEPSPTWKC